VPRVLVIDDEPGIRENLAEILEAEGYEVRAAVNGLDALAVLRGWVPDAILLDLMMPRMGGAAFREAQLARPELADVPTLVFTAYRDQADPALGNVDLLTKDIGAGAILTLLHERIAERPKKTPVARLLRNAAILVGGLATLAKVIWDLIKGRKYQ
jgi:CheY-like chemotaxis protein